MNTGQPTNFDSARAYGYVFASGYVYGYGYDSAFSYGSAFGHVYAYIRYPAYDRTFDLISASTCEALVTNRNEELA